MKPAFYLIPVMMLVACRHDAIDVEPPKGPAGPDTTDSVAVTEPAIRYYSGVFHGSDHGDETPVGYYAFDSTIEVTATVTGKLLDTIYIELPIVTVFHDRISLRPELPPRREVFHMRAIYCSRLGEYYSTDFGYSRLRIRLNTAGDSLYFSDGAFMPDDYAFTSREFRGRLRK